MIIRKFGGSSLRDSRSVLHIAGIIQQNENEQTVVVLSAFNSVTDRLQDAVHTALQDENGLEDSIENLRRFHLAILKKTIHVGPAADRCITELHEQMQQLERLLKGVRYTGEATPRIKDEILSIGERLAVRIMAGVIRSQGTAVERTDNDTVRITAHGEWGNGSGDLDEIRRYLPIDMQPKFQKANIQLVTGYFGRSAAGSPITFGRGGSDYVAALYADALDAEKLEIWKDVDGFLSGSPEIVENGRFIQNLSYDEAAELAYFGAKILHPRTVEPLLEKRIPVEIRNTFKPDCPGTLIGHNGTVSRGIVKSVTFDRKVALLRVHGVDVGYTVGLLSGMVSRLSSSRINIRSVMTSQTCINIMLDRSELELAHRILHDLHPEGIDSLEPVTDIGLVAVVGEGLLDSQDSLALIIADLYRSGIHVDLIVTGASRVASYFVVPEERLGDAVRTVHETLLTGCLN